MTSILTGLVDMLQKGAVFDWPAIKPVLIAGACAAISYLLKNYMSNSRGQMFTREPA
jgi:hypothetical protein